MRWKKDNLQIFTLKKNVLRQSEPAPKPEPEPEPKANLNLNLNLKLT